MRTTNLGASGITASVMGLGTWAIGGWGWGGTQEQESIAAIKASIDLGVTLIDTAPAYSLGLCRQDGQLPARRRHRYGPGAVQPHRSHDGTGTTALGQLALAGARNVNQAQENARAGSVVLGAADLAKIKTAVETHLKDFDQRWYAL
jgi:aryl-alcohol dehydrogenase-like predicted oxidoreductase